MKNAGMAGAVALVGIGLITIGLGNFANTPQAIAAAPAVVVEGENDDVQNDLFPNGSCGAAVGVRTVDPVGFTIPYCEDTWEALECRGTSAHLDFDGDGIAEHVRVGKSSFTGCWDDYWSYTKYCHGSVSVSGSIESIVNRKSGGEWKIQRRNLLGWGSGVGPDLDIFPCANSGYTIRARAIVWNNDGLGDILIRATHEGQSIFSVHLNVNTPPGGGMSADLDGDGLINGSDLLALLGQWTG